MEYDEEAGLLTFLALSLTREVTDITDESACAFVRDCRDLRFLGFGAIVYWLLRSENHLGCSDKLNVPWRSLERPRAASGFKRKLKTWVPETNETQPKPWQSGPCTFLPNTECRSQDVFQVHRVEAEVTFAS